MQTEQLLCWSGMTEHSTSSSNEEDRQERRIKMSGVKMSHTLQFMMIKFSFIFQPQSKLFDVRKLLNFAHNLRLVKSAYRKKRSVLKQLKR